MTDKQVDPKAPWVSKTAQDKPAQKDLSLDGITQNRPRNLDPLQAVQGPSGTPISITPKKLDQQTS